MHEIRHTVSRKDCQGQRTGLPLGQLLREAACLQSAGHLKSRLALGRLPGQGLYFVLFSGSKVIEKQSLLKLQIKIHTIYNKAFLGGLGAGGVFVMNLSDTRKS